VEREEIRREVYARVDELPTLPDAVPRIRGLLANSASSARDLTEVVAQDLALTAKVLRLANSAHSGFRQEVASLARAVALLGFTMVPALTVSLGALQTLPAAGGALPLLSGGALVPQPGRRHRDA
jgi:HD-like signal output (HDOD) protein